LYAREISSPELIARQGEPVVFNCQKGRIGQYLPIRP